eukprot:4052966-Amphidinium_carterae.2
MELACLGMSLTGGQTSSVPIEFARKLLRRSGVPMSRKMRRLMDCRLMTLKWLQDMRMAEVLSFIVSFSFLSTYLVCCGEVDHRADQHSIKRQE